MATKKALGRGLDALVPEEAIAAAGNGVEEAAKTVTRYASVIEIAASIRDATVGMSATEAQKAMRMMIRLCQFQLDNGYLG